MTDKLLWKFPSNEANEIEGPNDPGITHFMGQREESIIRESVQNSLDAQRNAGSPVQVALSLEKVATSLFDGSGLAGAIRAAADSTHYDDDAYRKQFERGYRLLRRVGVGSVDCLRIIDSNTTGADDEPRPNKAPSKWEALTKGTGSNAKDQRDSAGSFGLGKFAAFAATDFRTVLYSVAYESHGDLRRRFQGKSILVSHKVRGKEFRKTGYLGDANFMPVTDTDVSRPFRLAEPGTALYILGYKRPEGWQKTSIRTAIKHFFHAIVRGKLEMTVDGKRVDAKTVAELTKSLKVGAKTSDFVNVSQLAPVAETEIDGIGKVSIRIQVDDDKPGKRNIALVRDAGMMLTDNPRDMNLTGVGRIPQHWKGFTAIIECLSHGKPSLLRDSESPQHNRISEEYITDPDRRREAVQRLRELGQWCRDQIEVLAEPASSNGDNANEVAKYLPVEDDDGEQGASGENGRRGIEITAPIQSLRAPPRARVSGRGTRGPVNTLGNGTVEDPPDGPPKNPPDQPSNKRRRRTVTRACSHYVERRR